MWIYTYGIRLYLFNSDYVSQLIHCYCLEIASNTVCSGIIHGNLKHFNWHMSTGLRIQIFFISYSSQSIGTLLPYLEKLF